MKRPTGIALVSAFAITVGSLAGCSAQAPSGDAVELELWTFKQSHVEALKAVAEQCFPEGDVTIDAEAITPDDAFTTKVQAAVQTKDLPDLLMAHSASEDWQFAQAGILADITDYFDSDLKDRFTDQTLSAMELTQAQIDSRGDDPATTIKDLKPGSVYSVPLINGAANVIVANKKLLEAAGVDSSTPPENWEDWVTDMEKTVAADPASGGLVTGLQIPQVGYFWMYEPMATGYLGVDAKQNRTGEKQTPAWNSPESIETLELWDMLTPVWVDGVFNLGIDQADQAFAQEKAAYDMGGTFTVPFLLQQGMSIDDLLIFQTPLPKDGEITDGTMTTNPLVSTGITSTTKHPEEAKQFLDCLSSADGAATFMNIAGDLASAKVNIDEIDSDSLKALASLFDRPDATVLNPPASFPLEPTNGDTVTAAATLIAKISAGELTPQEVGDQLTKIYQEAWAAEQ